MEFITKLKEEVKNYYRMFDLMDEHYEEKEYENIEFVETISTDEHRWYILEENVYKMKIDGKDWN